MTLLLALQKFPQLNCELLTLWQLLVRGHHGQLSAACRQICQNGLSPIFTQSIPSHPFLSPAQYLDEPINSTGTWYTSRVAEGEGRWSWLMKNYHRHPKPTAQWNSTEHVFPQHVDNLSIWMATHEQSLQVYEVYSQRSTVCSLRSKRSAVYSPLSSVFL